MNKNYMIQIDSISLLKVFIQQENASGGLKGTKSKFHFSGNSIFNLSVTPMACEESAACWTDFFSTYITKETNIVYPTLSNMPI